MKAFRLKQMEQYIIEKGTVSMEELCRKFQVSINTVRMDVATLVEKGTIEKIYGGVTSKEINRLIPFEERGRRNLSAKQQIGQTAASLVEDGDVIFVDSGTTTMHIFEHIDPAKRVTVITHSLTAINAAELQRNLEVICLPGRLERKTRSLVDAETVKVLTRYYIKKSFMGAPGISRQGQVTNSSLVEQELKATAVRMAEQSYLLIDASKFDNPALVTYATLDQLTGVVTDASISSDFNQLCKDKGVQVMTKPLV